MPVVGLAEVLLKPVFTGSQRTIAKEIGPVTERAGRDAGKSMGKGMAEGLRSETLALESEVDRLGKAVSSAQDKVTASKDRTTKASEAEAKALGALRVAELKLSEIRESGNAKASALAAAEERVATARNKSTAATNARERSEATLSRATSDFNRVQNESADATERLNSSIRKQTAETDRAGQATTRYGSLLRRAFPNRPLGEMVRNVNVDTAQVNKSMDGMITNVQAAGTRGGRAFTRAFVGVTVGLTTIIPAAGAAGSALIATSGAVVTLASSLNQLAGVSALAPAGLVAIAAGAGVLKAAFSGMGEALKTATEATDKIAQAAGNPRIAAMAIEDANRAIVDSEQAAADARIDAARRVEDAQRSLQDAEAAAVRSAEAAAKAQVQASRRVDEARRSLKETIDDVARAQVDAARAVEKAQRREADAANDVRKAEAALAEAREAAQKRVNEVGRDLFDADRRAVDSAIAYRKAIAAFNEAKAEGVGGDELASLDNAVAKAYAADVDAKQAVKDLGEEHKKAKVEAKTASEEVLAAEEKLRDAQQAQADAVQARKDAQADAVRAQEDGAQRVKDAEQAVTDAVVQQQETRDDAALAAEQSSRAIQDAERGVEDAVKAADRAQVDGAKAVEQAHRNLERIQLQQAEQAGKAGEESELAMSKLTPAAQTAAAALLGVYERLKGIRNIAQENFFTGFTGPLLTLANTVMPQLEVGVGRIATAFGLMAQQAMTSLSGALDSGVLESLLTSVANIITNLTPAIDPLVQAFTTLALVGMPFLEDFATYLSQAADKFNAFVQGAAADGSLARWIEDGITAFQDLGRIIANVSGIIGALADAARAGGIDVTLGSLADALGRVRTTMEAPVFQDTMGTIFAGAREGMEGLAVAFEKLGQAFVVGKDNFAEFLRLGGEIAGLTLGALFTALSDPTFGNGLTTFLEGVKSGVETLAPLLPGLTSAVGEVLAALAPIVENLGPTLVTVFTDFATAIAKVIEFLSPLLETVTGSPVIMGFLIAAFTATAAAAAVLTLNANLVRIAMAAVWLVTKGGPAVLTAASKAFGFLNKTMRANPIGAVITIIGLLVGALIWFFTETEIGRKIIQTAWAWIKDAVAKVVSWFLNTALPGIKKFLTDIGLRFMSLWNKYVKPVTDWISKAWKDTVNYLTKDVPLAIATFVLKVAKEWDKLKAKAKEPIRFVVNKVINEGLIDTFNKIPGVNIKPVKLPKGFRKGGYTGDIPEDEAAGIVHGREFVFDAAATAAAGPKHLAAMAAALKSGKGGHPSQCAHATAATAKRATPTNSGFFMGSVNQIRSKGAYYLDAAAGVAPWNIKGAAKLWDGAAGLKVRTGRGQHQGYVTERERGGGILGYATGTNIDLSPSWKAILGPKQRLTIAAHEVGHAIGLPHDMGGASIMHPNLQGMAATPTRRDINNLQYLYPGGSGKAGSAEAENPFSSVIIDTLSALIKKQFPDAGMFVDAAGGLLKKGIENIAKFVDDIKNSVSKIAGNVVNSIKGFFGNDGAQAPEDYLLRDTGGVLPPGFSKVLNATGQNEFVVNNKQMRGIGELAGSRVQQGGDTWNVELPPRASVDDLMSAVSFQQRRNRRGGRVGV